MKLMLVNDSGEVLDSIDLDGYDLSHAFSRAELVMTIKDVVDREQKRVDRELQKPS